MTHMEAAVMLKHKSGVRADPGVELEGRVGRRGLASNTQLVYPSLHKNTNKLLPRGINI